MSYLKQLFDSILSMPLALFLGIFVCLSFVFVGLLILLLTPILVLSNLVLGLTGKFDYYANQFKKIKN